MKIDFILVKTKLTEFLIDYLDPRESTRVIWCFVAACTALTAKLVLFSGSISSAILFALGAVVAMYLLYLPSLFFAFGSLFYFMIYILSKFFPEIFRALKDDEERDERYLICIYKPEKPKFYGDVFG